MMQTALLALALCMFFFVRMIDSRDVLDRTVPGSSERQKRSVLSIPSGSTFAVTLDFIIPVLPLINQTNTYLWFDFPFTMNMPTATDLHDLYTNKSYVLREDEVEQRSVEQDRRAVYRYIEGFFQNFGLNGEACVQRTVCELAEAPLAGHHGLLGRALHLLFSPSLLEDELNYLEDGEADEYVRAFRKGRDTNGLGSSCSSADFAALCPLSVVKLLDV